MQHHFERLLALYREQLPPTIHGCFGYLLCHVTLISHEDLKTLLHIDLLIARWHCQGHSHAGVSQGLDDLWFNLFANLIRLTPIYLSGIKSANIKSQ